MATKQSQASRIDQDLTVDTREHGFADGPANVLVEIIPAHRGVSMAIVAAGEAGRYSFDFSVTDTGIEIEKAYIDGMHEHVTDLPDWVEAVRASIEEWLKL